MLLDEQHLVKGRNELLIDAGAQKEVLIEQVLAFSHSNPEQCSVVLRREFTTAFFESTVDMSIVLAAMQPASRATLRGKEFRPLAGLIDDRGFATATAGVLNPLMTDAEVSRLLHGNDGDALDTLLLRRLVVLTEIELRDVANRLSHPTKQEYEAELVLSGAVDEITMQDYMFLAHVREDIGRRLYEMLENVYINE